MRVIGVASSIPNLQAAVLRCAKCGSLTSLSRYKGQGTASPDRFDTNNYDLTVKCIGKSLTTHAVSSGASEKGESTSLGKKVGVIGFGQMGGALVRGFLNSEIITVDDICASVTTAERQNYLKEIGINNVFGDAVTKGGAAKVAEFADVIIVGVKPQVIKPVLQALAPAMEPRHLVISIAAGIKIAELENALGKGVKVVRVMPNTPALVQQGASAFALGSYATEDDAFVVESLLSKVGLALRVREKMMNGVTGVSGSGPAYVYMMIEAMADGGVAAGLPREIAQKLAAQTVAGASQMLLQSELHPGSLKDMVASPAGTTIAAITELETSGMRGAFIRAVLASAKRSEELG
jgi:pyrroline-5-carboxylate reductase